MRDVSRVSLVFLIAAIAGLLPLIGCGGAETKTDKTSVPKADGSGDGAADNADPDAPATKDTKDPAAAAAMWINKVKPAFEKNCVSCHAEPRFVVAQRGPMTIFSYDAAKKLLADGTSSQDNGLIRKLLGVGHTGGARCKIDADPCSLVVQWRLLEIGSDSSTPAVAEDLDTLPADADPRLAAVVSVSSEGQVVGWAVNKQDLRAKVAIKLVLDAPLGTGVVAVTTTADKLGDDGKHPGDHGFFVSVPLSFRTGVERNLYIYDGADQLLTPTPLKFKAYASKAAGKTYFQATVAPLITAKCSSCHQPVYETFFSAMIAKGPNEGGTATNNPAVNKPGGVDQHSGGNACGGINGSPCKEFQTWWTKEFQ